MMPKLGSLVALLLLLAACQQAPLRDESSARSRVAVGSRLTLHQSLSVPAGHARVFLQQGLVVAKARLNRYQPHCNVEVRTVSSGDSVIEPDSFIVTAVSEGDEEVVERERMAPERYASSLGAADEMTVMLTRFVRHTLVSPRQPQVMYLTCHGGFAEPWQVAYPSMNEIRRSLGELITLQQDLNI